MDKNTDCGILLSANKLKKHDLNFKDYVNIIELSYYLLNNLDIT